MHAPLRGALAMALALTPSPAQQTRANAAPLFPFAIGARWVYRDEAGNEMQLVCCRRVRAADGDWFAVLRIARQTKLEFWRERDGAVFHNPNAWIQGKIEDRLPSQRLLSADPRWQWREAGKEGEEDKVHAARRTTARMHVPAGELECAVATITTRRGKDVERTTTYAFAPGVGLVSVTVVEPSDGARILELVRYEPPPGGQDEALLGRVGEHIETREHREWLTAEVMCEPQLLAFGERRFVRVTMLDGTQRHYTSDGGTGVERVDPDSGDFWSKLARAQDPGKVAEAFALVGASTRKLLGPRIVAGLTTQRSENGKTVASAVVEGKTSADRTGRLSVELTLTAEQLTTVTSAESRK